MSKDYSSESVEKISLQRLGEEIGDHNRSWTIFNLDLIVFNAVLHEKIAAVNMF